jgi:DNA-binding CsgD family transcriptional regulator
MNRSWPLVGREDTVLLIRRTLAERRAVVVTGAAGVGKTRLMTEAAESAPGRVLAWVKATTSATAIPFGAATELLPDAGSEPAIGRAATIRRIVDHVRRLGARDEVVVVVDDAHLLDDASATLIHQLVITGAARVVATLRASESAPEPIVSLWKEGLAERIELPALTVAELRQLLLAVVDGPVDELTVQKLWRLTLGNALFVRELVEAGLGSGNFSSVEGVWRWDGPVAPSTRLSELIDARMGRLDHRQRELLEMLAVGEPLGSELLVAAGMSADLESVETRGLAISEQAGRRVQVRLAHPLYGEVLRERTSAARTRRLYRALASVVATTGARREEDRLRVVAWQLAGAVEVDSATLTDAARRAIQVDFALAERLARAALDAGAGFSAALLLAKALVGLSRPGEAEEVLARLGSAPATDGERAELAAVRAANLYLGLGDFAGADAALQAAASNNEQGYAQLALARATYLVYDGRCWDALRLLDNLEVSAHEDAATGWQELATRSMALAVAGRYDASLTCSWQALVTARGAGSDTAWEDGALNGSRAMTYVWSGEFARAEALVQPLYVRALERGWSTEPVLYANVHGEAALYRGQVQTARRWLNAAKTHAAGKVPVPFIATVFGDLAKAAAAVGDLIEAESALEEMERSLSSSPGLFHPWGGLARGWVAAQRGELRAALRHAFEIADLAARTGQTHFEVTALYDALRFGGGTSAARRLIRATRGVDGALAALYRRHAQALTAADGVGLLETAEALHALGSNLYAAEAAAQAACLYRAAGRVGTALDASRRSGAWASLCEGARTAPLLALDESDGLTKREREVSQLAARGLTSKQIAGRLGISPRTVDNTLRRVYAKLGVTNRRQLPDRRVEPAGLPRTSIVSME